MTKILSIPDRIRLFKEINRVHREIYGWKMLYDNAWDGDGRIDIESDLRFDTYKKKWVPIVKSDTEKYYFYNNKGEDIPSLRGIFGWQAYNFYHLDPYKFDIGKKLVDDQDLISDNLGKRVRPDVSHPVDCLESVIDVQQRMEDGKIWISSNWLYHPDCYGSGAGVGGLIYEILGEVAKGDEKAIKKLQVKYEEITDLNGLEFKKALERYYKGEKLQSHYWNGGSLFAASKEYRIRTLEQLNEVIDEEAEYFRCNLEEFIKWFRRNGLNLGERAEEDLRKRMREFYDSYLCNTGRMWCNHIVEEDGVEPSDVFLWWGGEPNSDNCYAFLTLFFEVDPDEIGTRRFDEKVSRNLRAIINIAEKERTGSYLSSYREYDPNTWKVIFS